MVRASETALWLVVHITLPVQSIFVTDAVKHSAIGHLAWADKGHTSARVGDKLFLPTCEDYATWQGTGRGK